LSIYGHEVKEIMKINWNSMRALSLSSFVVRLGLIGAVAGFGAWVMVLGLHVLFEVPRPSGMALLLAIPRGAIFGMILAFILHAYWKRQSGKGEMKGQ
jgi:hypothetical protein